MRDIPLLIATGRRLTTARRGLAELGLAPPAVVLNGGLGVELATDIEFHRCVYEPEVAMRVLGIFAAGGHVPCAYATDGKAHLAPGTTTGPRHLASFVDGPSAGEAIEANPIATARSGEVVGFSVIGVDEASLAPIAANLRLMGSPVVHYADPIFGGWSLMTQPPGVSKWTGVLAYADRIGLSNPRVLAIGDGANDIELLEGADVALGVRGGDAAALAASDHLIDGPETGGWASLLDYL